MSKYTKTVNIMQNMYIELILLTSYYKKHSQSDFLKIW